MYTTSIPRNLDVCAKPVEALVDHFVAATLVSPEDRRKNPRAEIEDLPWTAPKGAIQLDEVLGDEGMELVEEDWDRFLQSLRLRLLKQGLTICCDTRKGHVSVKPC